MRGRGAVRASVIGIITMGLAAACAAPATAAPVWTLTGSLHAAGYDTAVLLQSGKVLEQGGNLPHRTG
jgi:hypothetical protein